MIKLRIADGERYPSRGLILEHTGILSFWVLSRGVCAGIG